MIPVMTTERRFCNIYLCRSLKHIESLKSEYNTKDEQWQDRRRDPHHLNRSEEETEKVSPTNQCGSKIMFCCFEILFNSGPRKSSNVGPEPWRLFLAWALVRVILAPGLTGSPVIVIIIIIINIVIFVVNIIIIIVIIIGPNWEACDCDMLPTTYCSRTTLRAKYKFHTTLIANLLPLPVPPQQA